MTAQELATIRTAIKELHAVPGLKDADTLDRIGNSRIVRTTTTSADLNRLLKNARRQARRRQARLLKASLSQEASPTLHSDIADRMDAILADHLDSPTTCPTCSESFLSLNELHEHMIEADHIV